jgi:predicted acylesterase/phospholipase RssA
MATSGPKIGLALSGGGFRAAIFHLGVIRRLEELGIMKDVAVVSTVSGGSIVGAYYLCEMEDRLRSVPPARQHDPVLRVELFEQITEKFLAGVDHNLRTRALIFTPFYHPWLFVKTLFLRAFRASARSELIQAEYDSWFYNGDTLDHLPSVTPDKVTDETRGSVLYGPKLVINTTSLLSGERVSFSREPVSGINELSKVNGNVLRLSHVVGASSGVPVLFPPTAIGGELLVDGGVSDNQGLGPLLDQDSKDACDLLLVSDASGQLEALDAMSTGEVSVYSRTNGVLMHQVRRKLIELLQCSEKPFAFVHLFLNLKDRQGAPPHLSSAFIPAVARLRTDLDQFSYIEREALMYHGYTLIDAQLRLHCKTFLESRGPQAMETPLLTPPLFREEQARSDEDRDGIRLDLEAGHEALYLLRCFKKYGWKYGAGWALSELAAATIAVWLLHRSFLQLVGIRRWVEGGLLSFIPSPLHQAIDSLLAHLQVPLLDETVHGVSGLISVLLVLALALYVAAFPVYWATRHFAVHRDREEYRKLTGCLPTPAWGKTAP